MDSFTYRARRHGLTCMATVTITVNGVNDPPMADDETVAAVCNIQHVVETECRRDGGADRQRLPHHRRQRPGGDCDPSGAVTIVRATGIDLDATAPFTVTTTEGGTVTLHADGSFVYTPEGGDRGVAD